MYSFFVFPCFGENKRFFFGNSEKVGMFAMSYILIGKRKPANLQAFFMPKCVA
ncbi:hypothetical protein INE81_01325 [Bacteroides salyersiae]|nr:hypothetical protein INE81_01325 [Bacteroides salyersiae]